MKFLPIVFAGLIFSTSLSAQVPFDNNAGTYRIVYSSSSNGNKAPAGNRTVVYSNTRQTLVTNEKDLKGDGKYPFELFIVDRNTLWQQLYAVLNDSTIISTTDSNAIRNQRFELLNDSKTILGYACKKAKTVINSNTIELWYTNALPVKGAPSILGQDLGLVLEMTRNNNFSLTAEEVKKNTGAALTLKTKATPRSTDLLSYRDEIWRSRFTTIPLFTNQLINFSDTATVPPGVMRFANGTIAVKKIRFPKFDGTKKIFLDLSEQSNGDAYDRTGTVFLIPADKRQSFLDGLQKGANTLPVFENGNGNKYQGVAATAEYDPAIELMRFFTPFGVKQYNHIKIKGKLWEEAVNYRQDISDFASLLDGKEVYIGVFIGNYDKGGHRINANITIHNDEGLMHKNIIPLFNTLNIMEMAGQEYATMFDSEKGLTVEFELKEPVQNAVLRYTTTGHGGWENGDEFLPKENTVLSDGNIVFKMAPWREDCGSYRLYNPASGNFGNGLSSSDYSRSNWCPGTVTNPYFIPLGNLAAGRHSIQVKIPQGKREGDSFSAWNVSGVIVGD
ncbi:MAG: PNGase F N-terminal domain-containing protein [Ferruginibacter sp.]